MRPFTQRKDTCDFKSGTSAKQLIHHVYLPNFSAASRLLATSNKISAAGCSSTACVVRIHIQLSGERDLNAMTQTRLCVRLVQTIQTTTRRSTAISLIVLTMLLVTGSLITGCGSGGNGDGLTSAGSSGDGSAGLTGPASATLAWDPVGGVWGYFVHYGTQSSDSPGSCAYAQSAFSSTPTATVAGLAANTTYYFAVSSYNGLESTCSVELTRVTDPELRADASTGSLLQLH